MFFINRGNSSFLLLAIVVLGFFFLINFLPYILLFGGIVWAISYGYKKLKKFSPKFKEKKSSYNTSKNDFSNFNNANVIDVEYTDVK